MTQHPSNPREPARSDSAAEPQTDANAAFAEAVDETAASASKATADSPAESDASQELVAQLRTEIASLKDRELRTRAELENYRKRAARELHDGLRYANLPLLRDLLPILDNTERAIQAAEQNADSAGLLEGVRMMHQQLLDVLQRHHCKTIEALHAPFDPNLHHAILQQPSDEFPPNTVVMVTQNGYKLHDRVVRPSQVFVSTSK